MKIGKTGTCVARNTASEIERKGVWDTERCDKCGQLWQKTPTFHVKTTGTYGTYSITVPVVLCEHLTVTGIGCPTYRGFQEAILTAFVLYRLR